ncbi:MAG: alpha/beta hydrolase [Mycobacteriales bacterium]
MTQSTAVAPVPDDLASGRIAHDGFDTHYLESGTGRPVLLIHGSGPGVSGRANWQGLMRSPVRDRNRLVAPDVLGFGDTRAVAGTALSHENRVRHLLGFLDAAGLDTVDVIGNSMGGALALALASRHPERVRRMVLMGSVGIGFPITPGLDRVWGYTPSPDNMREIMRLFAYDQGLITEELITLRYEASAVPDVQQRYAEAFAAPRQRHLDAMALSEVELAQIHAPTLLVHGRDDQIIPLEVTSLRLLKLLPTADLVIFSGCGHWTQIERAQDFQRQVDGFFAA